MLRLQRLQNKEGRVRQRAGKTQEESEKKASDRVKVVEGADLSPSGGTTRGEIALHLYRMYRNVCRFH